MGSQAAILGILLFYEIVSTRAAGQSAEVNRGSRAGQTNAHHNAPRKLPAGRAAKTPKATHSPTNSQATQEVIDRLRKYRNDG